MSGAAVDDLPRTVVIVDDHRTLRRAVRSLLDADPAYRVIAEAADGEEGVELVAELRPDVVLMDLRLPGIDGAEATRRILLRAPLTRVVLMSTAGRADLPLNLLDCGAISFLQKETLDPQTLHELVDASRDPARRPGLCARSSR